MLKIATILGTRPELIRLAPTIRALDRCTDHVLVHTGQNYDFTLNEIFFREMDIRRPDRFFEIDTSSLGGMLGDILVKSETLFRECRPDALLVLGDTNSAIAAIMARRMKIPIYHMEAGNRSFDRNVPEETNRRIVDHISDFNLVYTEHARRNLLSEGISPRRIYLTGSPMKEVLAQHRGAIEASDVLARLGLTARGYLIVSMHREENVDSKARLAALVETLNRLARRYDMPVIVSTHPRTRNRLDALEGLTLDARVRYLKPFGFHDYNHLQMMAFCAVSDSGTIAEESALLDFPAITPRDAIERPEAMDTGAIVVTGLDGDAMLDGIEVVTTMHAARTGPPVAPTDYAIVNTSERVVKLIVGTARLSNGWDGIRMHDYV